MKRRVRKKKEWRTVPRYGLYRDDNTTNQNNYTRQPQPTTEGSLPTLAKTKKFFRAEITGNGLDYFEIRNEEGREIEDYTKV